MQRLVLTYLCLLVFQFATLAGAATEEKSSNFLADSQRRYFTIFAGPNIAGVSGTNSDLRTTYSAGLGIDRLITEQEGVFLNLAYADRGLKLGGLSNTASYLDVMWGFTRRFNDLFSASGKMFIHTGGVFGIGLTDFKGNVPSSLAMNSKNFFGLYVDVGARYAVGDGVAIGYKIWAKDGLTDALPVSATGSAKFQELGAALELVF